MTKNAIYLFSLFILINSCFVPGISAQNASGMYRYLFSDTEPLGDFLPGLYVTDMSGDGRFVVIESNKNIATVNPRNTDGNLEIFLFDAAQRHIFQITDTKSALVNVTGSTTTYSNIAVRIHNTMPTISNNGKWIAFSSNATTSTPSSPNGTNPGSFDGNESGTLQILQQDGNLEVWLYELPPVPTVNLDSGATPAFVDLSSGSFTLVTNTPTSRLPQPGTSTSPPVITADNQDCSFNDTGSSLAFTSTRDIVPGGNAVPDANSEIFVFKRLTSTFAQVTRTPRGPIASPIYNKLPTISGNGLRVSFTSTGTNPVPGMSGGNNPEFNEEVHFTDLNSFGEPTGTKKQITFTAPEFFEPVNIYPNIARALSRNGRYIAFVSSARLDVNSQVGPGYALFLYDSENATIPFRRVGPYDSEDTQLPYDGLRYARFTDYDLQGAPSSIVFTSRINFCPDGTMPPTGCAIGLNPSSARPSQVYSAPLPGASLALTKLSNSPLLDDDIEGGLCVAGNSKSRISCGFAGAGFGLSIDHILTQPVEEEDISAQSSFITGAGGIPVSSIAGLNANMLAGGYTFRKTHPLLKAFLHRLPPVASCQHHFNLTVYRLRLTASRLE